MVIYTEFLYNSVPGIILGIKPKTIAYMTQLTSLNTCVLHHGYIYRISVYFSSRYNSEYQTKNYCIYDPINDSKYMCIRQWLYIYTEFLYILVPGYNSEHQTRNYCAYVTPLTSLNTCVSHHGFLYVSISGIILSIKSETIAYMTQLTSLNICVLHHERIFLFSHI